MKGNYVEFLLLRFLRHVRSAEFGFAQPVMLEYGAAARPIPLARGELICLTKASKIRRIEVRQGLVWLTSTPADRDVVLPTGEQFHLTDRWPFIVQALKDSEVWLA